MQVISSAAASGHYMLHSCLRKSLEKTQDAGEAHVMAMRTMMTMRIAPNLPRSATAAAGGTKPARTLIQMESDMGRDC